MNTELENIVDSVLLSGELTDRSRELLMKKAEQLGVDLLDFELELESKISQKKASTNVQLPINTSNTTQSNKEGDLKKCPSCGAPVGSFSSVCQDCGHEFRNIKSANSVQDFYYKFSDIDREVRKEFELGKLEDYEVDIKIYERKARFVDAFPIPNAKEDILEFLTIAVPEVNRKFYFMELHKKELRKAWRAKCEQIVMKARLSLKAS